MRQLIALRKQVALLNAGDMQLQLSHDDNVLHIQRHLGEQKLLCVFNFSQRAISLDCQGQALLLSDAAAVTSGQLSLAGVSFAYIQP